MEWSSVEKLRNLRKPHIYRGPIYHHGSQGPLNQLRIGFIGSRLESEYGIRTITACIQSLADLPITIVSGGAPGIDSRALRTAEQLGMRTIHVPGYNLETYIHETLQKESTALASRLFLSTLVKNESPKKWTFVVRNNMICALCDLIIAIEGTIDSGTWYTINYALKHAVPIAAIPGSIFHAQSTGCNQAIRNGASIIVSPQDIREKLFEIAQQGRMTYPGTEYADICASYIVMYTYRKLPHASIGDIAKNTQENPLSVSAIITHFEDSYLQKLANIQNT